MLPSNGRLPYVTIFSAMLIYFRCRSEKKISWYNTIRQIKKNVQIVHSLIADFQTWWKCVGHNDPLHNMFTDMSGKFQY